MPKMLGTKADSTYPGCGRGCCCDVDKVRRAARACDKREAEREVKDQQSE